MVIVLCGAIVFLALRQPEIREKLVFVDTKNETAPATTPSPDTSKEIGQLSFLLETVNNLVQQEKNETPPVTTPNPGTSKELGQLSILVEKVNELVKRQEKPPSTDSSTGEPEKETFNQRFEADKAFAQDELFAITSKRMIPRKPYTDIFYKGPFTLYHPEIHIVRALGRETRENYLFIVPREFFSHAKIHQKFTKSEMSSYEYFLSEDKLESTIFRRRFQARMVD